MLFSDQQLTDPNSVFNGWGLVSDPGQWESRLPGLATMNFFRADPAYDGIFNLSTQGKGGASFYIQELGRSAVFSALRNCVAQISVAWGYFSSAFNTIRLLFKDTLTAISRVLDTVSTVMDSIELAVNSISWIPIVGWIIKIVFEVAKIVTSIISAVQEKRAERKQAELDRLARQYALPMAEWTPEADTVMGQMLQMQLAPGKFNLEWAFMPRYPANKVGDFVASRQKYNPNDSCFSGWLVYSKMAGGEQSEAGLGFVPGTMNIHGAMSLNTQAGGDVRDYGDFFPITRSVANQLWSQAVKGDSGLTFAIDTDKVITAWKEYVSSAYHYGVEALDGWSMIAGDVDRSWPLKYSDIPGLKYNCSECDTGSSNCDSKLAGKKREHRWRTPPGDGHKSAFLQHLHQMFGWKTFQHGKSLKEDERWDTMTPVVALRNLRERQEAMIRSPKCMYLDDSSNSGGTGTRRFNAIRKGSDLHEIWVKSVTAMFESGDWKKIDYRDVIQGEDVDQAIRLALSNQNLPPPEKYFNLDKKWGTGKASLGIKAVSGPSVLGDPEPPKPPGLVEVTTANVKGMALSPGRAGQGKTSTRKKSSAAPLLIGAAAIGLLMMRGRK